MPVTPPQAKRQPKPQGAPPLLPGRPTDPRVAEIILQLRDMLRQKDALAELARRAGLSESRLSHLFRAATGWSLSEYAKRVRLAVGQELLESSPLSIKEVAAAVGMDRSHFSRDFKTLCGLSPREYRLSVRAAGGAR